MKKFLDWLKIPGGIVAAVIALSLIARAFGIGIETPGDKIAQIEAKNVVQDSAIIAQDMYHQWEVVRDDSLEQEKDISRAQRTGLIEKLVVGECLESMFEKLGQQQLIETCSELGVTRSAGDAIDRKLEGG